MDHILFDTDVILDFFFDRKPHSDFTAKTLQYCQEGKAKGYTTPVIIANTYYILRKTATHEYVVIKLNQLLDLFEILDMNKSIISLALQSEFKDFEDALQNYSGETHPNVNIILTRNIKDYKKSKLAIFSPDTYIKGLQK
ncbi:type II toxin-antitoxin system VapC family toxin [Sediminicola luteus]|uniref:DNA-binding protein n=1 Tax=Sediminicola luteus TaxID=319238 RepID=A0A2A4G618_9FLAO|nr:PIN domain-containing protein [Sediminicola luteus]PCE63871.1 DNA-binding protein [Sediminicola luteus]